MRALLIEDDPMIGKSLVRGLGDAGISVDWVQDGLVGAQIMEQDTYGLALLDLGLPNCDGMEVLARTRKHGADLPIIVITARDDVGSRIQGLDQGADDYILKPFEIHELLARIRAVLRRRTGHSQSLLHVGELTLNLATHEAAFRGRHAQLSAREFALVWGLAENSGAILSKSQLEEKIYGWEEEIESNAIDVLIHYVRRKLHKDVIKNIRGAGWMMLK
jgi:DNA-binding response OmpR family regulator